MRFTITAAPSASVEPSGRPSTARRWFSNWLVSAPSIVQWPVLCTRGANSFASSLPLDLEQLDREHADVAERVEEPRRDLLGLALRRVARRSARDAQDPVAVHVLDERLEARLAVARRAPRGSTARGRTGRRSSASSSSPSSLDAPRRRAGPCRRSRAGASSRAPGSPLVLERAERARSGSRGAGRAPSRRGGPGRSSSARAAGTARDADAPRSTGTFSNS